MSAVDAELPAEGRPSSGAVLAEQIADARRARPTRRDLKPLRGLAPYLFRHKADLAIAGFFLLFATGTTLALTQGIQRLVDSFKSGRAAEVDRWFLVLVAIALASAIATALRYFYVTKVGERSIADLRQALYAHILTLDPAFFLKIRLGEVLSRMTTDIAIVETLLSSSISITLRNFLGVAGAVTMMALVSLKLTLWVLLLIPIVLLPMFAIGRWVRTLTTRTQDLFAQAVGVAGETLDALETVQAFGREASSQRRFGDAVEFTFATSVTRMRARALMTSVIIALMYSGAALVIWLGAQEALVRKTLTYGQLFQFGLLAALAASSVGALGEMWGDIQKASGAMQRIGELMDARPTISPPTNPAPMPDPPLGEAAFERVTFAYPGRPDLPALRDFSLTVNPGETIALVGPSGAGKSTVFRLLLRFFDPQAGTVSVDGVDLTQVDPRALRERIGLVAQESPLFSGSALDNVRFGREDATVQDVREAAAEAQALGFVDALPEGFNTPLGERARSLSGGQRQRLAIARALVRGAPILLLDEATSALDAENERLVQSALDQAMEGRTTIVIAHRLATVLRADRIIVMDQGRVVEEGTHASLVSAGGLYARLAELQFETTL
ncbi:MAG TPA: ABC transporter transmembrane domain-containing protein [Caulobacteraceae bacterium]|jgi:ATP-binding cassette subfamily B protein|nr:ABC transporter transmembrane domain-containing protein [Caulobacteraceae bacterium]